METRFFLPFIAALLFVACNNEKAENSRGNRDDDKPSYNHSVVGKWEIIKADMKDGSNEEERMRNATVEFTRDGDFISKMDGETDNGTYTVDEDAGKLTTRQSGGKTEKFTIEWDKSLLIISNAEGTVTLNRLGMDRDKYDNKDDSRDEDRDDSEYSLVGRWRVTGISGGDESSEVDLSKMTIEFKSNGKYTSTDEDDVERGTYTYNEKTGTLVTTPDDGKAEEKVEVEFVNKNKVSINYGGGKIIMQRE